MRTPWLLTSVLLAIMGWCVQYGDDLQYAARTVAGNVRTHASPMVVVGAAVTAVGVYILFSYFDHVAEEDIPSYRYSSLLMQHVMAQTREGYFRGAVVAAVAALLIEPVSGTIATAATDTFNASRGVPTGGKRTPLRGQRKKLRPCALDSACDVAFVLALILGYLTAS